MKKAVILDYGAGNTFSVQQALIRLGVDPLLSSDPEVVQTATHVIFPGVGHAATAMEQLRTNGLDKLIPELKQPVLGICLGMQLMCSTTEEGETKGLGIFSAAVTRFSDKVIVPHMGWNDVRFGMEESSYYFVHSFKASLSDETWGICNYDAPFSAALRKNNFTGVQFHPEKSGAAGATTIQQFLAQ